MFVYLALNQPLTDDLVSSKFSKDIDLSTETSFWTF